MTSKDDEYAKTRKHAGELSAALLHVTLELSSIEIPDGSSTYPRGYATALLEDSRSTLQAINNRMVTRGQRSIVANVLTAIQELEKAGQRFGSVIEQLADIVGDMAERGLVIEGHDLSNSDRPSRLR